MKNSSAHSIIAVLRALLFSLLGAATNHFLDTGSPDWLAASGACLGVIIAFLSSRSRLTFFGFLALNIGLYIFFSVAFFCIDTFIPDMMSEAFAPYEAEQHIVILLLSFYASGACAWFFYRIKGFATLEIAGFLTLTVSVLAGHRNFHFESPKILSSFAWYLGVSPLSLFIITGLLATLFTASYAYATRYFAVASSSTAVQREDTKRYSIHTLAMFAAFCGLLYFICSYLYGSFHAIQLVRTTNGVGLERSPGMSPLGFHSALGSTNQPAALVRLDGDYPKNPYTPMLYLRENALSEYNGKELVMADRIYDHDVTNTAPDEHFVADEDPAISGRTQVSLSAYLLTNHNTAFAIDYPLSITPIKNPNPQRFKAAFRAVSLAPQFALGDLTFDKTGDDRWNDATWKHYLKTNEDPRYKALAEKISLGQMTNVQKASTIVEYLSQNAIYTLTPNHTLPPDGDPVAPFIFGDMRGYCVHFAHATVYMLRSLGIPARIGTGYLTDLSQAKDGHILLRMSDRHAWAEVYLEGKGWVPFDTKPQHVESHAETTVDMKLLEELMGMIGPDELILPKDLDKDEAGAQEPPGEFEIKPPNLVPGMIGILTLFILLKIWLRFSWLLPSSQAAKLRRAYRAMVSYCYDIGLTRHHGETRLEYRRRIAQELGAPLLKLTPDIVENKYGNSDLKGISISDALHVERQHRRTLSVSKKILAFLSPIAVFSLLRREW